MSFFNKNSKETRNLLIGLKKEFRDQLISLKNEFHINEKIRKRLINIESKINFSLSNKTSDNIYFGHPDQAFGHYTYAQHGEDLIFSNIFWLLNIKNPSYIDIGAHHPINISNTALLYKRGSSGINIEANPNLIDAFNKYRPRDINLNIGVSDKQGNLEFYCIDDYSGRNTFDKKRLKNSLLSIDIEGFDYRILSSADFSNSFPKVICTEITQLNVNENICELLQSRDYIPYVYTVGNIIFVHQSVYKYPPEKINNFFIFFPLSFYLFFNLYLSSSKIYWMTLFYFVITFYIKIYSLISLPKKAII